MSRIPQRTRVLEYMEKHGSISQAEADELKVKRLAARIDDLRKAGNNIVCEMVKGKNEYGVYYYGRYRRA
jgi:hypothetical protein